MDSKIEKKNRPAPPNAGKGRPKGAPNKATKAFRETVQALLERNTENVAIWLQAVADGDPDNNIKPAPDKALDLLAKLAEYAAPKLSRTEVVGDNDSPLAHKVEIAIIDAAK